MKWTSISNVVCSQPVVNLALQDLLARGNHFSPHRIIGYTFGGRRDFAFGIYARADKARELLKDKWAGKSTFFSLYLVAHLCEGCHEHWLQIVSLQTI